MVASGALVDVFAGESVALEASAAGAFVRTERVRANRVRRAFVSSSNAFVLVFASPPQISNHSILAFAAISSRNIYAVDICFSSTLISDSALVNVLALASKAASEIFVSLFAFAAVRANKVLARRRRIALVHSSCALVQVNAKFNSVAAVASAALASITSRFIKAFRSFVADAFFFAFVDVLAFPAIAFESVNAHASVPARFVPAFSAKRRTVVFASFALVNILARKAVAREALFALARHRSNTVRANCMVRARVVLHAFVHVSAG